MDPFFQIILFRKHIVKRNYFQIFSHTKWNISEMYWSEIFFDDYIQSFLFLWNFFWEFWKWFCLMFAYFIYGTNLLKKKNNQALKTKKLVYRKVFHFEKKIWYPRPIFLMFSLAFFQDQTTSNIWDTFSNVIRWCECCRSLMTL